FFATDGVYQTLLTVLDDFGAYPAVIERELNRYLPFLATTKVLLAAVGKGVGREVAHAAIGEHAVAVALEQREKGTEGNDLLERLAADSRLRLSAAELSTLVAEPITFPGPRAAQIADVLSRANRALRRLPDTARHAP